MNFFENAITDVLGALASLADGDLGLAFLAMAAAGTIAMAALQVIKEVTPYRRKVQYNWFVHWQNQRELGVGEVKTCESLKPLLSKRDIFAHNTKSEIVELSAGNAESALFSLPVEDMVALMKLAIPVLIDEANRYPSTLLTLSFGASATDLLLVLQGQPPNDSPQAYFDARARVTRRMERTLDGICIAITDRWRFRMQVISLGMTTIFVMIVMFSKGAGPGALLLSIPIGIVGGYFAPITRDLLAALQRLR